MKTSFIGYYPPSEDQYKKLWKEGLIVLDTNVLLNLYRLPNVAREELFGVLESLKERLWIPHQVALEFHRRRSTVIAAERKITSTVLNDVENLVENLKNKVECLELDKRGLDIDPAPLLEQLSQANEKLVEVIKKAHVAQLDISGIDPIRDRIDSLLEGRVGDGPINQKALDELIRDGEDRYKEKIPPGFEDTDKEKNPNEAFFNHDRIKYPRKFGDLILWRQLIQHVNPLNYKYVLLVTADEKEDWWWKQQGKTIGPKPELIREIIKLGSLDFFWMYRPEPFIKAANQYAGATVSPQSLAELRQVSRFPSNFETSSPNLSSVTEPFSDNIHIDSKFYAFSPVTIWLKSLHDRVYLNNSEFPDIIAFDPHFVWGYEIKYQNLESFLVGPAIINSLLKGYVEIRENRLSYFTMIIVIPEDNYLSIINEERVPELNVRLDKILKRHPVTGIVVGSVINNYFEILAHRTSL